MKTIDVEMNNVSAAFSLESDNDSRIQVLDLCSALEDYSAAVLDLNFTASIDAVFLSHQNDDHRVLIPFERRDSRVQILFTNITMLVTEYDVNLNNILIEHSDATQFKPLQLYEDKQYDLVLCDEQVLRTQKRETYREMCESTRLTNAQLILGLQRIKLRETLIILQHKLET